MNPMVRLDNDVIVNSQDLLEHLKRRLDPLTVLLPEVRLRFPREVEVMLTNMLSSVWKSL